MDNKNKRETLYLSLTYKLQQQFENELISVKLIVHITLSQAEIETSLYSEAYFVLIVSNKRNV